MRAVIDTNVWISALLLPKSTAGNILSDCRKDKFAVVFSQPMIDELQKVLSYPKILKRIHWDDLKIEHYLQGLKFFSEFITLSGNCPATVDRDHNDNIILHTFLESKADYLVTGDTDLLVLSGDYPVISITEFQRLLRE